MKPDQTSDLLLVPSLQRGLEGFAAPTFLFALVVIALLALPTDAGARKHPGTSSEFTVKGTNGYSLTVKSQQGGLVSVLVANRRPPVATISAAGNIIPASKGNVATSTYVDFDSTSQDPNVIQADLGVLGTISVAFQPSGETRVSKVDLRGKTKNCVGAERIVRRLGTFAGTIRFQGEGGYTTVDLSSAAGTVGTSLFRNCSTKTRQPRVGRTATRPSRDSRFFLTASSKSTGDDFYASTGSPCSSGGSTCFFATNFGALRADKVGIVRLAQATAPRSSFAVNDALGSATLTPPAPFSGSGIFQSGAPGRASNWIGSLQVAYPGLTAPLAGPSFDAKLRQR